MVSWAGSWIMGAMVAIEVMTVQTEVVIYFQDGIEGKRRAVGEEAVDFDKLRGSVCERARQQKREREERERGGGREDTEKERSEMDLIVAEWYRDVEGDNETVNFRRPSRPL
jgi:hypothetical protein